MEEKSITIYYIRPVEFAVEDFVDLFFKTHGVLCKRVFSYEEIPESAVKEKNLTYYIVNALGADAAETLEVHNWIQKNKLTSQTAVIEIDVEILKKQDLLDRNYRQIILINSSEHGLELFLDSILLQRSERIPRILFLNSNSERSRSLIKTFKERTLKVQSHDQKSEFFQSMPEFDPDLFVIEDLPEKNFGIQTIDLIRSQSQFSDSDIMIISDKQTEEFKLSAFNSGVDNILQNHYGESTTVNIIFTRAVKAMRTRASRKALEERNFELSNQQFSLNKHAIVSETDKDGVITYANEKFCETSGYELQEIIGRKHNILKSGVHSSEFYKQMWKKISSGKTWSGVFTNRKKNGETYWVESTIVPFLDEWGRAYKYISIRTEITELMKVQNKLEESERSLRHSQIFANIGSWDWNIQTGEMFWSEMVGPILGFEEGKQKTTYEKFLSVVHSEDKEKVLTAINDCIEAGKDFDIEHRIQWPDGEIRWAHEKGDVVRDENNTPLHMLGVTRDITVQKRTEEEMRQAKRMAEKANKAKSEFLSSMSHELRTPLNAILGFAQLLDMTADTLQEEDRESVKEILKGGEHLLGLINDVLDLSKIEAGKVDVLIEPVSTEQVLTEVKRLTAPIAIKYGIELRFQFPQTSRMLLADKKRLKQVAVNLISNAIKYNKKNGEVNVSFSITDDNYIRLHIEDTGIGISEEDQRHMFEAFNRLGAEESEVEGTGIGLVITLELIELMHGRLSFESKLGVGTKFWIDFPSVEVAPEENVIEEEKQEGNLEISTGTEVKILYVEDNATNRKVVERFFQHRPQISLSLAKDGEEGLKIAEENQFDLFILDIRLPGKNGFEVLSSLKEMKKYQDTPAIALSANAMEDDVQKGMKAGFQEYLRKPVDLEQLYSVIQEYLKK